MTPLPITPSRRTGRLAVLATVALMTSGLSVVAGAGPGYADPTAEATSTVLETSSGSLTAQVSAEDDSPVTGGVVEFSLGSEVIGTAPVVAGVATWSQAAPTHSYATEIRADYQGTTAWEPSADTTSREVPDAPVIDEDVLADVVVGTSLRIAVDPTVEDGTIVISAPEPVDGVLCTVAGAVVSFLHAGVCDLRATQAGDWLYATVDGEAHPEVYAVETTLTLTVQAASLTARVTAVAPSTHVPDGAVEFFVDEASVGTAALVNGRAVLTRVLDPEGDWEMEATYAGNDDASGSDDLTSRSAPFIDASVSSAAKRRAGWYRTPVTVRFECEDNGAPLVKCPGPRVISTNGAKQVVRGTVTAVDGGAASATVLISLDRVAPRIKLTGIAKGKTVKAKKLPKAKCVAVDTLSGPGTCSVSQRVTKKAGKKSQVSYTATATDRAGNNAKVKGSYTWVKK